MDSGVLNSKNLFLNNLITCIYLPALIFVLHYSGNLYNVGKIQTIHVEFVLAFAEILKYFRFSLNQTRYVKKTDTKKFKIYNFCKSILALASMVAIFYIAAVLFGAPVFADQYETFSFAIIMTILTVLPCCLYLGADSIFMLFTSLSSFDGNEIYQKFLLNIRLTIFGAWLGAVLIPLDWNKPYQEWPVPCCLGAVTGCFISNLISVVLHSFSVSSKKTGKFYP